MAIQIKVPAVGESITEVTIANWLKKDGDVVKVDEVIAELESDKASFELPASSGGVLKILKQQGETVPIGEAICEIEPSEQAASAAPPAKAPAAAAAPSPKGESSKPSGGGGVKEMKVPAVGESITEVTISTWLKKEGDFVKLDEVIAEVELPSVEITGERIHSAAELASGTDARLPWDWSACRGRRTLVRHPYWPMDRVRHHCDNHRLEQKPRRKSGPTTRR